MSYNTIGLLSSYIMYNARMFDHCFCTASKYGSLICNHLNSRKELRRLMLNKRSDVARLEPVCRFHESKSTQAIAPAAGRSCPSHEITSKMIFAFIEAADPPGRFSAAK